MTFDYKTFKKEIFSKLTKEEKNTLFYWSLTDPSSWEEVRREYFPDFECGKLKVLSIVKKYGKTFKDNYVDPDPEEFYAQFVQSEFLTNFLLAAELEPIIQKKFRGELDVDNLVKTKFPDNVYKVNGKPYHIEVKGVLSGRSLKNRVVDEVVANLKTNGENYDKFLLLILFPFCPNEERGRAIDFIGGYYGYEDIDGFKGDHRRVLCQCLSEKFDQEYCIEKLVERVVKYFHEHISG